MTKEITKAILLQEMQDAFKLRDFDPAKFLFDETVVPVYNIERHLKAPLCTYVSKNVSSGPVGLLCVAVPYDEKWYLRGYNVVFMAAGAYTVTGVYVKRVNVDPSDAVYYLDMEAGQSASYAVELSTILLLSPGDQLWVYVDSYTSPAALRLYIDVVKETIR